MEDEMIFDIKIYDWGKNSSKYSNRPRRIDDGEYHIEWHRQGIEFKQCPDGIIHRSDGRIQDVCVRSPRLVCWNELMRNEDRNESFEFKPSDQDNPPRYEIRVLKKSLSVWIEWNTRVPDNINTEVMWQMAQIEEWKWMPQMPLNAIRNILKELQDNLPEGIDDTVRDLILNTWQQRWKERAAQGMLSSNETTSLSDTVNSFKLLMYDLTNR